MQDLTFWDSCLRSFEKSLPPQQFNSWIKPLQLQSEKGSLILTAPNSFTLKLVQERFFPEIARQAKLALSTVPTFEFRVQEVLPNASKPTEVRPAAKNSTAAETKSEAKPKIDTSFRGYGKLNPN